MTDQDSPIPPEQQTQPSSNQDDIATTTGEKRKRENTTTTTEADPSHSPFYKTSLCSYFRRTMGASCSHGSACKYAHGEEELRPRPDNTWDPTSERAKKAIKLDSTNNNDSKEEDEEIMMTDIAADGDGDGDCLDAGLSKCLVHLPRKWQSDHLRKFLSDQGILLKSAKKKKGMSVGFVSFEDAEQLKKAIEELEGRSIGNKNIKVADVIPRQFEQKIKSAMAVPQNIPQTMEPALDGESTGISRSSDAIGDADGNNDNSTQDGSNSRAKCARDVATPLAHMPYDDQLEHKKNSIMQMLKKLTRNARKACPNGVSLPEWILRSREIGGLPCELEGILESPLRNGAMELFGFPFQSNNMIVNPMFFIFIFLCSIFWISRKFLSRTGKKKAAPKAGGAWPLIGHLHLLGGAEPPHKVLGKMAEKYGPIFTIKIGVHRALVVSNWETAKECFTTHDKVFADRPKTLASELLTYDGAMMGFSPYGSYWRHVRKITTVELLSTYRLGKLKDVRESEVRAFLKELYKLWDENRGGASKSKSNEVLVEMKGWFGDLTLNIVLRTIVGKAVGYITSDGDEVSTVKGWKKGLTDFFYLIGMFSVSDALPFLRFLDLGGNGEAMKKIAKELDLVVEDWLEEHKQKRAAGIVKGKEDFMDLMLDVFDDGAGASDTTIKATSLALILAASDTTAVTLTWALSLLVNNPDVLKKAQLELDTHVGKERQVEESDVQNLVYLKAVLKETLRLYPAGPLLIPHEAIEDCTIDGYHVPRGTRLLVNLPKIHRDARVWSNPNEFDPERFLTTHRDFDVRGHNFEFFPFGSGRRMCPGVSFALHVMELALASLLHGFDFATPSGEPVDMHESSGLTNLRATPLEVLLSPRLPSRLYGH